MLSSALMVPWTFLEYMKWDHAIILAFLVQHSTHATNLDEYNDWMEMPTSTIREFLPTISVKRLRVAIKTLKDRECIQIERRGMPSKRYLRVNRFFVRSIML